MKDNSDYELTQAWISFFLKKKKSLLSFSPMFFLAEVEIHENKETSSSEENVSSQWICRWNKVHVFSKERSVF